MKGNIFPTSIMLKVPNLIVHLGDVQKTFVSPDMRPVLRIFVVVEKTCRPSELKIKTGDIFS